jgi:putative adhesin
MRKLLLIGLFAPATLFAWHSHSGISINNDGYGDVTDCSQLRVTIDDEPAVRAQESVPVADLRSLSVHAPQNGGIYVSGAEGGRFEVTACKAAAIESALGDIRLRVSGNEVTADGPASDRWVVYFIVRAPRDGSLDLATQNGPISLRNVTASIGAHAVNGPIAARESAGTLNLETTNGPISIDGGSGTAKLNAANGPISVRLRGSDWNGSLDAHSENGPVSLRIPAGFRSGVVVESEGRGPVSCHAGACKDARRTWDDEDNRRIEFGSGPTVVHLSTVNGPVSVREAEE